MDAANDTDAVREAEEALPPNLRKALRDKSNLVVDSRVRLGSASIQEFRLGSDDQWRNFGIAVGGSTSLRELRIDLEDVSAAHFGKVQLFLRGMSVNRSIKTIVISTLQPGHHWGIFRTLSPFIENNEHLSDFRVYAESDRNPSQELSWMESLCSALDRRRYPLKKLRIGECVGETLRTPWRQLLETLTSNDDLELESFILSSADGTLGTASIISNLLQNPGSVLKYLNISDAGLGREQLLPVTEALVGNDTLNHLYFGQRCEWILSDEFWNKLGQILFNTTTINDTYFTSNHTLKHLRVGYVEEPSSAMKNTQDLLRMNWGGYKKRAARDKVIKALFDGGIKMEHFNEMKPGLLVCVIAWVRKSNLTASFEMLRNMPFLCGFPPSLARARLNKCIRKRRKTAVCGRRTKGFEARDGGGRTVLR